MSLLSEIGGLLKDRGLSLAVAESCTGGMLGAQITSVSGSSEYFMGGVIAYSNKAKSLLVGVPEEILASEGAVSAGSAGAMAAGACERLGADIGLGITGIAGPGGGSEEKPVGLVFIGLCVGGECVVRRYEFCGDREGICRQSCTAALTALRDVLQQEE